MGAESIINQLNFAPYLLQYQAARRDKLRRDYAKDREGNLVNSKCL